MFRLPRAPMLLAASAVLCCQERPPPPGSGALETTPTAPGATQAAPVGLSSSQVIPYPNGAILVLEPLPCRVQAVEDGKQAWLRNYPTCAGLLEGAVGRDSTAYVRAGRELAAIERNGAERWRITVDGSGLPRSIASPTTLADSRLVLADSPRSIVVYDADGRLSWRFALPSEEVLAASPQGLPTEGVAVLTGAASYIFSADGELRWRITTRRK